MSNRDSLQVLRIRILEKRKALEEARVRWVGAKKPQGAEWWALGAIQHELDELHSLFFDLAEIELGLRREP